MARHWSVWINVWKCEFCHRLSAAHLTVNNHARNVRRRGILSLFYFEPPKSRIYMVFMVHNDDNTMLIFGKKKKFGFINQKWLKMVNFFTRLSSSCTQPTASAASPHSIVAARKRKGKTEYSASADFSKIVTVPTIGPIRTRFQWFYDLQNMYFQMSIVTIAEECGDYSKSTLKNTDFGAFFWSTSNRFSKIVLFFPITFIHT